MRGQIGILETTTTQYDLCFPYLLCYGDNSYNQCIMKLRGDLRYRHTFLLISQEATHQLVEESQLFLEGCQSCYVRLISAK